jgi:uncharacterized protein (DUF697 family)
MKSEDTNDEPRRPKFGKRLRKKLDEAAEFARRPFKTPRQDFSEDLDIPEPVEVPQDPDGRAQAIVANHARGAAVAMFAIPVPGADVTATMAVWAKMIVEIAEVYGYQVSLADATALASDLLRGVVMTTLYWFASAKVASGVLKFLPGAGTLTAYALDALIAAFGAKRITAGIGLAAAGYYKSGKTLAPADLKDHLGNFFKGTEEFLIVLSGIPARRL